MDRSLLGKMASELGKTAAKAAKKHGGSALQTLEGLATGALQRVNEAAEKGVLLTGRYTGTLKDLSKAGLSREEIVNVLKLQPNADIMVLPVKEGDHPYGMANDAVQAINMFRKAAVYRIDGCVIIGKPGNTVEELMRQYHLLKGANPTGQATGPSVPEISEIKQP